MTGIQGKVVAITGASSGIGKATALLLAERGAKVVVGARRQDQLDSIVSQIKARGGQAVAVSIDIKKREDMTRFVSVALATFGQLDVLVSNAGTAPISLLDELRVEDWEETIDVNVKGLLHGIAAALPVFREQKFGHFVNILSTAGLKIVPTMAVYAGSKNAARAITEGLRQEAGANLRVTAISPGLVQTGLTSSMTSAEVASKTSQQMSEIGIPADAIARCIAFAIEQPADVDVGEIVVRPTAQS
ncbi:MULTISPECIES: SDR family oxidoreductase [unclassified Variovorax]|uniref:SDR family oxidoreductase n=1 Tax=unclassified Variovorax TaxID=663243 RepID=UPI003F47C699